MVTMHGSRSTRVRWNQSVHVVCSKIQSLARSWTQRLDEVTLRRKCRPQGLSIRAPRWLRDYEMSLEWNRRLLCVDLLCCLGVESYFPNDPLSCQSKGKMVFKTEREWEDGEKNGRCPLLWFLCSSYVHVHIHLDNNILSDAQKSNMKMFPFPSTNFSVIPLATKMPISQYTFSFFLYFVHLFIHIFIDSKCHVL